MGSNLSSHNVSPHCTLNPQCSTLDVQCLTFTTNKASIVSFNSSKKGYKWQNRSCVNHKLSPLTLCGGLIRVGCRGLSVLPSSFYMMAAGLKINYSVLFLVGCWEPNFACWELMPECWALNWEL